MRDAAAWHTLLRLRVLLRLHGTVSVYRALPQSALLLLPRAATQVQPDAGQGTHAPSGEPGRSCLRVMHWCLRQPTHSNPGDAAAMLARHLLRWSIAQAVLLAPLLLRIRLSCLAAHTRPGDHAVAPRVRSWQAVRTHAACCCHAGPRLPARLAEVTCRACRHIRMGPVIHSGAACLQVLHIRWAIVSAGGCIQDSCGLSKGAV